MLEILDATEEDVEDVDDVLDIVSLFELHLVLILRLISFGTDTSVDNEDGNVSVVTKYTSYN